MTEAMLSIDNAAKRFVTPATMGDRIAHALGGPDRTQTVHAVTDVTLTVAKGEVVGLVGESGCGKSTLGRMISGIYAPSSGAIALDGTPVAKMAGKRIQKLTTRVQMVHQDPFSSLDPRMRVANTVAEGPVHHQLVSAAEADDYVADMLVRVGLDASTRRRFPHQFSGGQRQRIAIARALAMQPDLLVLDEPVASLDVSIQAQVLNLFLDLRQQLGLTAVFISHDLGVVRHVSDRVAIMYLGRVVELADTVPLFDRPAHPYTRALLDSVPKLGAGRGAFSAVAGEIPSPLNPPPGCAFHPRCPFAGPRCSVERPILKAGDNTPGTVACHLYDGGTGA